jgi:uncharacterized RDD family membrane protein YckC
MSATGGVELGGFGQRLGAQLVDLLWVLPLYVAMLTLGGIVNGDAPSSMGELLVDFIIALLVLTFWAERRATPGKLVLGLRIVDAETGGTPRFGRLVLRYLGYLVSALPLGLGYLWALWDPRRQAWHDKMAGTLVVVERR